MNTLKRTATGGLAIGALGVVFGDIGTSPLYALQAIFGPAGHNLVATPENIYGLISIVIWALVLVISFKYVLFIMRADNRGEGGILALLALLNRGASHNKYKWLLTLVGLLGVALFYGDSAITPAISVLSAVEGLNGIAPALHSLVLPITFAVLASLFWVQRYGTGFIGRFFGPVMLVWFITIGLGGAWQVFQHPDILRAASPYYAVSFFATHPVMAFLAMGAVVLAITGAEALYADMGHFGRKPISRAWFLVAFPTLILCYMGQSALLLEGQLSAAHVFFRLYPEVLQIPIIVLATCATVIASQSVISGAFSLTRQAIQLNLLPKLFISHTSEKTTGQIYIPVVNFLLFVAVMLIVVSFGTSQRLANAYGIAVSGTLLADTFLFLAVMHFLWRKPLIITSLFALVFYSLDLLFVSSGIAKVLHGGWLPLLIAFVIYQIIAIWRDGQRIVIEKRRHLEGNLSDYVQQIRTGKRPITRIPGEAVYIGHHPGFTPLAFRSSVEDLKELHEKVVIIYVITNSTVAHVPYQERAVLNDLGYNDGISELQLTYGFHDLPNIPKELARLRKQSPELDFDPHTAPYFISLTKAIPGKRHSFAMWRKSIYCLLANNSTSRSDFYKLPIDRTIEVRSMIVI